MCLIFWFSAQPADESSDMSLSVGKIVGEIFVPDYDKWTEKEQEAFAERIDYPVRKAAHATEYACFAVLLMGMYQSYGLAGRRQIIASFLSAAAYAATDEFHQLFVPGRGCRVTDVLIDSLGAAAGILIFLTVSFLLARPAHRRKETENVVLETKKPHNIVNFQLITLLTDRLLWYNNRSVVIIPAHRAVFVEPQKSTAHPSGILWR